MDESRYDVWSWDQPPQKIPNEEWFLDGYGVRSMSRSDDPWMVIYQDTDGGLSACTFVKESSDPHEVFSFYNEQLCKEWSPMSWSKNGLGLILRSNPYLSFREIWTNLSTVLNPTYESMKDIQSKIGVTRYTDRMLDANLKYPMHLIQSIRVFPQSINKYTIV